MFLLELQNANLISKSQLTRTMVKKNSAHYQWYKKTETTVFFGANATIFSPNLFSPMQSGGLRRPHPHRSPSPSPSYGSSRHHQHHQHQHHISRHYQRGFSRAHSADGSLYNSQQQQQVIILKLIFPKCNRESVSWYFLHSCNIYERCPSFQTPHHYHPMMGSPRTSPRSPQSPSTWSMASSSNASIPR